MAKISEVITLKTGYANFVELKSAFEEAQENADRMAMYRPTKAHRRAFERICRGLYQPTDKKFYLLSGSYGTGKSHLCLMTANVLSRSSGDPAISGFYDNYAKLDPEAAKHLKNIRKDGQYLIAICDYHSGRRFEDVVMKAVFDACEAKGLDTHIVTEFDEAERQLAEWEMRGAESKIRNFYEDFSTALAAVAPAVSVEQLRSGLKEYDSHALENFRDAFRHMMGGIEFQSKAGNLIPIIQKLVHSKEFKDRFKGLAIFFDEFGFTLEKANYSKDILQGFMETICKNEPDVLFIGCIHKDFKAYADKFSQADANVMSARITQVDLLNEGIEEIITAIVETDKQNSTWKQEIEPKTPVLDQLIPTCKSLDLFPWIDNVNRIRSQVLEDIYGVHPMALSCLLKLSSEVGSDARSTFTFFADTEGNESGSYPEFIEETDITGPGGKLNLYTTDRLVTFFKAEISPRNSDLRDKQRQIVNGYRSSLDAVRKATPDELLGLEDDERLRVLKTILIYLLCNIPTSLENIQFGLYCTNSHEKKHVEALLKDLVKYGAVFYRQQSKTYELAAGSGEDPYDLIERFLADSSLHPVDTVTAFLEEAGGKNADAFIEAKSYNLPFTEDKRFRPVFIPAKDLGEDLWESLQNEYEANKVNPNKSYEGTLVYALCEDEAEIKIAREAVQKIPVNTIAVSVPHSPIQFSDLLLRVKACRHYTSQGSNITAQTESRLRDIFDNPQDGYLTQLKKTYEQIIEGGDSCWYTEDGKILFDKPQQIHKPADILCEQLYKERCRIKHPDLNQCHDDRWKTGKNTALKQAVEVLLNAERVLIDNGNPDNHGEKRYLEKVLLKGAGALQKIGSEGRVNYFSCEADGDKISEDFPVLKELCTRLGDINPGQSFSIGPFLSEMRDMPYGAGGTALVLSSAHVIRAYGERLTVYKDSTGMIELPVQYYSDLTAIVADPAPQAVFSIREITPQQLRLVNGLAEAVGAPALKHGETRSLKEAFKSIMEWYARLPLVARIVSLYDEDDRGRLNEVKTVLDDEREHSDHFSLLLERLPGIYRSGPDTATLDDSEVDAITEAFREDIKQFESGEQKVHRMISEELCSVFDTEGDMVECEKVMSEWYTGLNPVQRDTSRYNDTEAVALLSCLGKNESFLTKITTILPHTYGFGPVYQWTSLHVKDYASKVARAKVEIEKARVVVPKPDIQEKVIEIGKNDSAQVPAPSDNTTLVYTVDGTDPKISESAIKVPNTLDLAALLTGQPNVKVKLRAVDNDGNYSDSAEVELIDKQHKYDLKIDNGLLAAEATFKCPDDLEGFIAVLRSLLNYGIKNGLINNDTADAVEELVRKNTTEEK